MYSPFKDNIWVADLGDMSLIRKFNERICFLIMCYLIFSVVGIFI